MLESTPVVGHVTAAVHLIRGDLKKAKEVADKTNRATATYAAGIGTGLVTLNPAAGFAAGVAAGAAYDGIDTAAHGKPRG